MASPCVVLVILGIFLGWVWSWIGILAHFPLSAFWAFLGFRKPLDTPLFICASLVAWISSSRDDTTDGTRLNNNDDIQTARSEARQKHGE